MKLQYIKEYSMFSKLSDEPEDEISYYVFIDEQDYDEYFEEDENAEYQGMSILPVYKSYTPDAENDMVLTDEISDHREHLKIVGSVNVYFTHYDNNARIVSYSDKTADSPYIGDIVLLYPTI